MKYKLFIAIFSLFIGFGFASLVLAQTAGPIAPITGNNQVVSRDAIGLRIVPNPEHLSPLQWYQKNIQVKGSPSSVIVDGYEAVKDGRTVYVNAGNAALVNRCANGMVCKSDSQCASGSQNETSLPQKFVATALAVGECASSSVPEIYTNIYVISYNQNPENATTDIFGQLLQYWKFNINVNNCSKTVTQACTIDSGVGNSSGSGNGGCPRDEVCGPAGSCSKTIDKSCIIDADCPQDPQEYCNSKKSTIIRDVKRLADLYYIKGKLDAFNYPYKGYPNLNNGTYLTNRSVSTWPSWAQTFSTTLGINPLVDPINKLGRCKPSDSENGLYDVATCWDENNKVFAGQADPLAMPAGSRVYYYQYKPVGNSFSFCAIFESGYVQGKNPLTPICKTGQSCVVNCTNKQCGPNGCGGSCGTCPGSQTCNSAGRCLGPR